MPVRTRVTRKVRVLINHYASKIIIITSITPKKEKKIMEKQSQDQTRTEAERGTTLVEETMLAELNASEVTESRGLSGRKSGFCITVRY
jgi:hypothetical protein